MTKDQNEDGSVRVKDMAVNGMRQASPMKKMAV